MRGIHIATVVQTILDFPTRPDQLTQAPGIRSRLKLVMSLFTSPVASHLIRRPRSTRTTCENLGQALWCSLSQVLVVIVLFSTRPYPQDNRPEACMGPCENCSRSLLSQPAIKRFLRMLSLRFSGVGFRATRFQARGYWSGSSARWWFVHSRLHQPQALRSAGRLEQHPARGKIAKFATLPTYLPSGNLDLGQSPLITLYTNVDVLGMAHQSPRSRTWGLRSSHTGTIFACLSPNRETLRL